ncbi:wall-associated receptor kinase-like 21 [Salvia splendens]|uniref:wall-associated receptor kinase-like 21 n=1 Tax=Salvia splendens TaxID=180675 RepID=UPI001C273A4A|nr:wall-associated receptor kinase-like 21 [Salvia splendens]
MIGLAAIITLIKYVTKNEKQKKRKSPETKGVPDIPGLYKFSKAEIDSAINHGGKKKCLGRGSAGLVYKGVLPSGQLVAIKQIYKSNTSDSFTREIEGLSRVRHPNLVCLFGCCIEDGEQYLVYEYCPHGNLAHHLLRTSFLVFLFLLLETSFILLMTVRMCREGHCPNVGGPSENPEGMRVGS